jgi:predicted dehydrogenase
MNKRFTSAIVGLGQVGQGYDYVSPGSSCILTHASAFKSHPGFHLVAGVDIDPVNRERFTAKFDIETFETCAELKTRFGHVDVVSIAVPTNSHFAVFQQILELKPSVIFCEKPIASTVAEACEMENMAQKARCAVAVNYTRRFFPQICATKRLVYGGAIGQIYKGVGWYTKGIVHCGSHFIDLLMDFLGKPNDIQILMKGRMWDGIDPEPDILLRFGDTDIFLFSGREESFSMGEMELIGTEGRFVFRDGEPIRLYRTYADPVYSGYHCLGLPEIFDIGSELSMSFPLINIFEYLTSDIQLLSNANTAIETLRVIETIKEKVEVLTT